MRAAINDYPICVALILAVAAAAMSMSREAGPSERGPREPGPSASGRPYQILEWMQIGVCSEVNQLAGAIGEPSAGCPEP